jgi:nitroreductase
VETWDAIRSRRNVREYAARPIPDRDLDRILEAARRTPSSSNQQRWDFIVSTDRDQLRELADVWRGARHVAGSAATIALIAPTADEPRTRESIQYDLGQATMSIMLCAADLGVGTGHSAVEDQGLARRLLGFPEDRTCAWLIALGYPREGELRPLRRINRLPFDEVVHRGRW